MKFLTIVDTDPNQPPLTPAQLEKLNAYTAEAFKSGVVVLTGGVVRPTKGIKAEMGDGGKVSFTDGPYAESKELIDGYAILEAPDLAAAKRLTAEFMAVAGCRRIEILPMFDYGGQPDPHNHGR